MKPFAFLLVLAVILLTGPSVWAQADNDTISVTGAVMLLDHTEYDFGEVPVDTTVTHIFPFRNTGNDTLRIHNVYSS